MDVHERRDRYGAQHDAWRAGPRDDLPQVLLRDRHDQLETHFGGASDPRLTTEHQVSSSQVGALGALERLWNGRETRHGGRQRAATGGEGVRVLNVFWLVG